MTVYQGWIGPGTLRNVVPVKFLTTGTPLRYSLGPFDFFLSQRTPLEVEQIRLEQYLALILQL
jgi:hypothetical protein